MKKKENRGGVRAGSGRKQKYGEPTTTIAARCPVSKGPALKKVIKRKLSEWVVKPKKQKTRVETQGLNNQNKIK